MTAGSRAWCAWRNHAIRAQTPDNQHGIDGELFAERRDKWRHDFGQWILENEALYFGDGLPGCEVSPLLRDWTKADMLATTLPAAIEFQRSAVETDFRAELATLSLPTLIVHGDADASAPLPLTGVRTAEFLPNCRLLVYENASQGLYLTHRGKLNADLLAFMEDHAAVPAP